MDECYMILLYIIIVFLPEQWRRFIVTVVGCYVLRLLWHSSLHMSATAYSDNCLPRMYLAKRLYYDHSSSIFSTCTMASFNCNRCWLLCIEYFLWFLVMNKWNNLLVSQIILEVLCWVTTLSLYYTMITDSLWSTLMRNPTLLFLLYHFGKLPILPEPRKSKEKKYLASYKFALNWDKKIEETFVKSLICTESRKSKVGVISFLVVWFHFLRFSVQVTAWWWFKPSRGLIGANGLCIGFIDIVALVGKKQWTSFLSWQHLSLITFILSNLQVRLGS